MGAKEEDGMASAMRASRSCSGEGLFIVDVCVVSDV
jgi:hypothetical protein